VVNGIIGLHVTGGSTNLAIHLLAMAAAAGIKVTWRDLSDLSDAVPLLARVYPNGSADVNHFNAAGGIGFIIRELLDSGLMHEDVRTVFGEGMRPYASEARLDAKGMVHRVASPKISGDEKVLAPVTKAFQPTGGVRVLTGNLVFHSQEALHAAFRAGELDKDFVAVVTYQGPKANGMPELHKLTPPLGILQDRGRMVALVTDGRMSGASGKVPAAIHVTPEALDGGMIGKIRTGDIIRLDATTGLLEAVVDDKVLHSRANADVDLTGNTYGTGRELFGGFRALVNRADQGAGVFG
jgi:phosphogluconate dehydratase